MKIVPGTYSPNRKNISKPDTLVDHEHARLAGINLHGSLAAMEQYVSQKQARMLEAYNARQTERDSRGRPVRARRRPPALDPFRWPVGEPASFCGDCPRPLAGQGLSARRTRLLLCWMREV